MNINSASNVSGDFNVQNVQSGGGVGKLDGMTVTQDTKHRGSVKEKAAGAWRDMGNFFKSLGSRISTALAPSPRPLPSAADLNKAFPP